MSRELRRRLNALERKVDRKTVSGTTSAGGGGSGAGTWPDLDSKPLISLDASGGDVTKTLPSPPETDLRVVQRIDNNGSATATIEDPNGNDIKIPGVPSSSESSTQTIDPERRQLYVWDGNNWYLQFDSGAKNLALEVIDASGSNVTRTLDDPGDTDRVFAVRTDTSSNDAELEDPNGNNIRRPTGTNTTTVSLDPQEPLTLLSDGTRWYANPNNLNILTVDAGGGNVTETLPAASEEAQVLAVRTDTSGNSATIEAPNNNIRRPNGTNSLTVPIQSHEPQVFVSDGTHWYVRTLEDEGGSVEVIPLDASSANVTESLPAPDPSVAGALAVRIDDSTNTATLKSHDGSQIINSSLAGTVTSSIDLRGLESVLLTTDGSEWHEASGVQVLSDVANVSTSPREDQDVLKWEKSASEYQHAALEDLVDTSVDLGDFNDIIVGGQFILRDPEKPTFYSRSEQITKYDNKYSNESITELPDNALWIDEEDPPPSIPYKYDKDTDTWEKKEGGFFDGGLIIADTIEAEQIKTQTISSETGFFNDTAIGGLLFLRQDTQPTKTEFANKYPNEDWSNGIVNNAIWIDTTSDPPQPKKYDKVNDQWNAINTAIFDGQIIASDSIETDQLKANAAQIGNVLIAGNNTVRSDTAPSAPDEGNEKIWIDTSTDPPTPKKYDHGNNTWVQVSDTFIDGELIKSGTIQADRVDADLVTAEEIRAGEARIGDVMIAGDNVTRANTSPSNPEKNDIWIDTDGNPPQAFRWNPNTQSWEQTTYIDGEAVVSQSIGAEQIRADSLTANEIDANTITADQIDAGAITAGEISAEATFSDKFVSLGGDNLVVQPNFKNSDGNPSASGHANVNPVLASNAAGSVDSGAPSEVIGEIDQNNTRAHPRFRNSLQKDTQYLFRARVASANASGDLRFGYIRKDPSGGDFIEQGTLSPTSGDWLQIPTFQTGLSGTDESITLAFLTQATESGTWYYGDPVIRSMQDSTTIEGGTIDTDLLKADAVTAEKILADTIGANEIAANSITGKEIKAGTLTADTIVSEPSNILPNGDFAGGASEWDGIEAVSENDVFSSLPTSGFGSTIQYGDEAQIGRITNSEALTPEAAGIANYPQTTVRLRTKVRLESSTTDTDVKAIIRVDDSGTITNTTIDTFSGLSSTAWSEFKVKVDLGSVANGNPFRLVFQLTNSSATDETYIDDVSLIPTTDGTEITGGAVDTDTLAANSVTANKIESGAVNTDTLDANSVTAGKIAADAVTGEEINATSKIEVGTSAPKILIDGDKAPPRIESSNFTSDVEGFRIEPNRAEFGDIEARGDFTVTTFTKESVNAVGGGLAVAESTSLAAAATTGDTTLFLKSEVFSSGQDVRLKDENEDDILTITSVNNTPSTGEQAITVGSGVSKDWEQGTAVLRWNAERIFLDATNDANTPFLSVVDSSNTETVRLGNLAGKARIDGSGIFAKRGLFKKDVKVGGRSVDVESFAAVVAELWHFDESLIGSVAGTEPRGIDGAERDGNVIAGPNLEASFLNGRFGSGVVSSSSDGILEYEGPSNSSFHYTFWINPWGAAADTDGNYLTLRRMSSGSVQSFVKLRRSGSNDEIEIDIESEGGATRTTPSAALTDDAWHLLTFERDGNTFRLRRGTEVLIEQTYSINDSGTGSGSILEIGAFQGSTYSNATVDELIQWKNSPIDPELERIDGEDIPVREGASRTYITGDRISTGTIAASRTDDNGRPISEIELNTGDIMLGQGGLEYSAATDTLSVEGIISAKEGKISTFSISENSIQSKALTINSDEEYIRFSPEGGTEISDTAFTDHEFKTNTSHDMEDSWFVTEVFSSGTFVYPDSDSDGSFDYVEIQQSGGEIGRIQATIEQTTDLSGKEENEVALEPKVDLLTESNRRAILGVSVYDESGSDSVELVSQEYDLDTEGEISSFETRTKRLVFSLPSGDASSVRFKIELQFQGFSGGATSDDNKLFLRELSLTEQPPKTEFDKDGIRVVNKNGDVAKFNRSTGKMTALIAEADVHQTVTDTVPDSGQNTHNAPEQAAVALSLDDDIRDGSALGVVDTLNGNGVEAVSVANASIEGTEFIDLQVNSDGTVNVENNDTTALDYRLTFF